MQSAYRRRPDRLAAALDIRSARYGLAIAFVALALGVTLALQHVEDHRPPLFLFAIAIAASAWFGGLGPGCLAAAMALPAGFYFYATSSLPAVAITIDDILLFFFFLICAMAGGLLSTYQREAKSDLSRAHGELEVKAAELAATNEALRQEILERQRAEQALADTNAKLAHAARLTAVGELTASIAHEINQPLTALVTNASCCLRWLEDGNLDIEEAREAAACVVQDGNRASDVIRRIRAMVKRVPPERRVVDVNELAGDAMALLEPLLRRNNVVARTDFAPSLSAIVGDRVQLQQVVVNLVLNAVEAMAKSRDRGLDLKTVAGNQTITLSVADTGSGFEGADPQSFFDAFVTSKEDGLGLGLSICRSIVEAHGGHLSARQRSPRGAIFEVVLPVEVSQ